MSRAADRDRPALVRPRWSLARQLFVLQVAVVALVVLAGSGLAWYDAGRRTEQAAADEVVAVARTLAQQPAVREAVHGPDPPRVLQPLVEQVRASTEVAFITVMSPEGIRYTHPHPERIGERFLGHVDAAPVDDEVFTETHTGTLGPTVRAVVPVLDGDGQVRGHVAVGIAVRVLSAELRGQVAALVTAAGGALLLGAGLTHLVGVRLRRHTHGLRPDELSRMYEYHDAILHAVREGLLLVSPRGEVTLCNDGAAALLARDPDQVEGRPVDELGLPAPLAGTLDAGRDVRDELHVTDDRVLLVSVSRIRSGARDLGTVATLRDHTELQELSGQLDTMRGFTESLRSQAHESANRLHTVVSLVELGRPDEAVAFATSELQLAQALTDQVVGSVGESVLAAVLLGKSAEAAERGVEVVLGEDSGVDEEAVAGLDDRDLVTVVGNLVDNAVEAVLEVPGPRVEVTARSDAHELVIRVADNGPGVQPERVEAVFRRGWSTKDGARGLGLALVGRSVRRHGGTIGVRNERGAVFEVRIPLRTGGRG
ncbi:sensor histidine kinase [Saccharopolyspora sp. HNM0983]|uniref:histidine kinase n=1 Tax=Saccharopolyspora montiporae TaxID=2781240 RepID=A0A929BAV7_9PSEU|nr:sensor histidine kinase [Saccharopolyspora sp. HNM0983]MBE9374217.1 sensor histidine kinase [Saccharopolyspora sp. HNM0983]